MKSFSAQKSTAKSVHLLIILALFATCQCQSLWTDTQECKNVTSANINCGDCTQVQLGLTSSRSTVKQNPLTRARPSTESSEPTESHETPNSRLLQTTFVKVKCMDCDYYIANQDVLDQSYQWSDLGKYGCTWKSMSFFTKHYIITTVCILTLIALILLVVFVVRAILAKRKIKDFTYKIHE